MKHPADFVTFMYLTWLLVASVILAMMV